MHFVHWFKKNDQKNSRYLKSSLEFAGKVSQHRVQHAFLENRYNMLLLLPQRVSTVCPFKNFSSIKTSHLTKEHELFSKSYIQIISVFFFFKIYRKERRCISIRRGMSGLIRSGLVAWKQCYAKSSQTMKANASHKNNLDRNVSSSNWGLPRGAEMKYLKFN